jgi:hypothetical protein
MKKIMILALCLMIAGCSFKNPHVGQLIKDPSILCSVYHGFCKIKQTHFDFDLFIEKGQTENDYIIKGTAEWTGPGVYFRQTSGNFDLYLVHGRLIVDQIPFLLSGGIKGRDNVYIEFSTAETFNMFTINYNIMVAD